VDASTQSVNPELKARHRKMWASGDYPSMVETFLLPLGPRLVEACDIGPGDRVLDVAAGTGNARAEAAEVELEWTEADAEALPFEDESFDAVISSIGVMFAPHHQAAADELVRVCKRGGRIALLSWTPEGMVGALFRTMGPFAPAPPPGAQPAPLWGSESHLGELFGERVELERVERDVLEVSAFAEPDDFGEHFTQRYGPTIAARANAEKEGQVKDFDDAVSQFCAEWNRGDGTSARFEMEYLVAVGRKR
jgi:SAM-dependent methyltransferase